MKTLSCAALVVALAAPAIAQQRTGPADIKQQNPRATTPGEAGPPVVKPGGSENSGPGSIGTVAPGGTGADSVSNNSGAAGNAQQNQRPVGNTGGGESGGQ